ncbi:hypothetical protein [Lysinibacillus parviboronicapiens]|uniref:hypothetical protein n=1 Tax=Lysinibacillus parviboronicapiens TaxID=436516 RepID=UPI000D3725C7|nr:hypothetical protein [Lysinibacillus parviboronicapiens]
MLELLRKQTLLTESFGISVDINKDNALALVELNEVQETSKNNYEEKPGVTISLDYEELDEIIAVLQYTSDQLKRGDNEFAI